MKTIISLCGKKRVGKDTACKIMGYTRFAFADALKEDLQDFIQEKYGFDLNNCTEEQKEKIRPLLVGHGEAMRNFDEDHWVNVVFEKIEQSDSNFCAITDCRYLNEVLKILAKSQTKDEINACVIRIKRKGFNKSNPTEEKSFKEIDKNIKLPKINNNGTLEEYEKKVKRMVKKLEK